MSPVQRIVITAVVSLKCLFLARDLCVESKHLIYNFNQKLLNSLLITTIKRFLKVGTLPFLSPVCAAASPAHCGDVDRVGRRTSG